MLRGLKCNILNIKRGEADFRSGIENGTDSCRPFDTQLMGRHQRFKEGRFEAFGERPSGLERLFGVAKRQPEISQGRQSLVNVRKKVLP